MSNYWLLYNPKTMKFYSYGGNGLRHNGSSKQFIDKAVDYINKLERENRRLQEQLKLIRVQDIAPEQLKEFAL